MGNIVQGLGPPALSSVGTGFDFLNKVAEVPSTIAEQHVPDLEPYLGKTVGGGLTDQMRFGARALAPLAVFGPVERITAAAKAVGEGRELIGGGLAAEHATGHAAHGAGKQVFEVAHQAHLARNVARLAEEGQRLKESLRGGPTEEEGPSNWQPNWPMAGQQASSDVSKLLQMMGGGAGLNLGGQR